MTAQKRTVADVLIGAVGLSVFIVLLAALFVAWSLVLVAKGVEWVVRVVIS